MNVHRGHRQRTEAVASDVHCLPVKGCNVYLVGTPARWVVIDTGWSGAAGTIREAAESLFGPRARPAAILITHAHPDHTGSAAQLGAFWGSPIYAHRDDLPYLHGGIVPDGLLDPVGKVFWPVARRLPTRVVKRLTSSPLRDVVRALPPPQVGVPGLPDWECIHTPGHSPGHVVFFRRRDRVLIAGDVVVTAYLSGLLPAVQKLSLPPWLVSWDWEQTKAAVAAIAELEPWVLATGHGVPMAGEKVAAELARFADHLSTQGRLPRSDDQP